MCEPEQRTGLVVEKDGSVVLTMGEDVHVDIDETAFRIIREGSHVDVVEVGGSGGRVISRATADQAR